MQTIPLGYAKTGSQWKAACTNLKSALRTFQDASLNLIKDAELPPNSHTERMSLESDLEDLYWELKELCPASDKLGNICMQLGAIANAPHRFTPINKLPPETLSHIFGIVITYSDLSCDRWRRPNEFLYIDERWKTYVTSLSSVQTTWRHLIVNTPSFWSHVDVFVDLNGWCPTPNKYSELCLQRAKATPLDLHICYHPGAPLYPESIVFFPEVVPLPQYLRDRAISSLNLALEDSQPVLPLLRSWQSGLLARGLNSLKIRIQDAVDAGPATMPARFLHDQLGSNIAQLHTLELKGVNIDWDQIRFPGLVELAIESHGSDVAPSIEQLRSILVSSPDLRSFRVDDERIQANDPANPALNTPIEMQKLAFLGLGYIDVPEMVLLLNIILPPVGSLVLSIGFPAVSNEEAHMNLYKSIGAFCARHQVRALALRLFRNENKIFLPALYSCLTLGHNLQALTLSDFNSGTEGFLNDVGDALGSSATVRRLHLHQCKITAQELQHIVAKCPIHWMRMDRCILYEETTANAQGIATRNWKPLFPFPRDIVDWLKNRVPNLYIGESRGEGVAFSSGHSEPSWWQTAIMHV